MVLVLAVVMAFTLGGVAVASPGETDNAKLIVIQHFPHGRVPLGVPHGGILADGFPATCPVCVDPDNCEDYSYPDVRWSDSVVLSAEGVPYYVNLGGSSDDGGFLDAIQTSADTWENDDSSYMNFTFKGITDASNSSLRNKIDGLNVATWNNLRRYPGAIAVTFIWTIGTDIVEVDMSFSNTFDWSSNQGFTGDPDVGAGDPQSFDVQNIATHEFGHWLLLGDLYENNQNQLTMYGYSTEGELKKRTLGPGDVLGINAIYPAGSVNEPPVVTISSPADGATYDSGAVIAFAGTATDTEDGDLSAGLTWTSSIDGQIGTGSSFSAALSDGTHTITAGVSDSGGKSAASSVTITVGTPVEPTQVGVTSITYNASGGRYGDKHMSVTVALVDDFGDSVAGASVTIRLDNTTTGGSWNGAGTTEIDGTLSYKLLNAPAGCYTTTVTGVSAAGLAWDGVTPDNEFCK